MQPFAPPGLSAFAFCALLESGPQLPWRKLLVANACQFAFRALTGGYRNDLFKNPVADLFNSLIAFDDRSGAKVDIVAHPVIQRRVKRIRVRSQDLRFALSRSAWEQGPKVEVQEDVDFDDQRVGGWDA